MRPRRETSGAVFIFAAEYFPFPIGNFFRLGGLFTGCRQQTVGTRVRGDINGQLVLEGLDHQPSAGTAGMVTYHTRITMTSGPRCLEFAALTPGVLAR
jgi:hypothetical protein